MVMIAGFVALTVPQHTTSERPPSLYSYHIEPTMVVAEIEQPPVP